MDPLQAIFSPVLLRPSCKEHVKEVMNRKLENPTFNHGVDGLGEKTKLQGKQDTRQQNSRSWTSWKLIAHNRNCYVKSGAGRKTWIHQRKAESVQLEDS